jgi:hypothetical protein
LWYSGSISEDAFLKAAIDQLISYNKTFKLDDRQQIQFKDPEAERLGKGVSTFTASDFQTLG